VIITSVNLIYIKGIEELEDNIIKSGEITPTVWDQNEDQIYVHNKINNDSPKNSIVEN